DSSCQGYICPSTVNFTPEKFQAYADPNQQQFQGVAGVRGHLYAHHNIDHYPGALFLRDWTILYLNAALKELHQREQQPPLKGCEDF
ncbi:hypothetical protein HYV87_00200, partial [Candidatus Woesearchaeota archaeon]|nr:hypothetical protein [Candidatus Woesearchaeota archaeon]